MAGSGLRARQALDDAVQEHAGQYLLVVEGPIPTGAHGVYMTLAGRPAMDVLADIGGKAAAIIAIGSCASWGGIPSADPDPSGGIGAADPLPEHSIMIRGCPPNSYTMLGVVLQYAADGTFPETNENCHHEQYCTVLTLGLSHNPNVKRSGSQRSSAVGFCMRGVFFVRHELALVSVVIAMVWAASPSQAQAGPDTYKAKCMMCHAVDGSGNTPAGKSMGALPFKTAALITASDADLIAATTNGKGKMPAYKSQLTGAQIAALITYLRTLQK